MGKYCCKYFHTHQYLLQEYKQGTITVTESCLTLQKEIEKANFIKEYVNIVQNNTIPIWTLQQIKTETKKDKTFTAITRKIKNK